MLDRLEQLAPALADLAHDLDIELGHALPDGGVELVEREELPVAQPRQHEALDDLHGHFHLRLGEGPRNQWSLCVGISGRFASESVVALRRNQHQGTPRGP